MRPTVLILPALLLGACSTSPTPAAVAVGTAEVAAFEVPMDPGQITCGQLQNPSAMSEAVNWMMGQKRAAVLAGAATNLPSEADVRARLAQACAGNPAASLWSVASQV